MLFRVREGLGEVQPKLPGLLQELVYMVLYYFCSLPLSVLLVMGLFLDALGTVLESGL